MALGFIEREGLFGPAIFCDTCGEPIEKAGDGLVEYDPETVDAEQGATLYYRHKARCDTRLPFWNDLDVLVIQMGEALGIDWQGASSAAAVMAGFEHEAFLKDVRKPQE